MIKSESLIAAAVFFFIISANFHSFADTSDTSSTSGVSSIESPTMPTVTAPTMPTITAPSLDSSSDDFYTPTTSTTAQSSSSDNTASSTTTASDTETTSSETESSNTIPLTTADLIGLDDLGALKNQNLSETLAGSSDTTTSLLQNLLKQLSTVKADNKDQLASLENEKANEKTVTSNQNEYKKDAILRFTVNGYDIAGTCKTVYFSTPASDGSFLFTGDRKYISSGKTISETFYFLFESHGNTGGIISYTVIPTLFQEQTNPYSFIYKLSQKKDLKAQKTGNLVTLHVTDPDLKADLLLNLSK